VPLTPRQMRFIHEYTKDFNGTKAAIRAGYSRLTADSQASRLLKKPKVRREIDANVERLALAGDVKPGDVLRELVAMANTDIRLAFDAEGRLLPLHELPADIRRMISSVETEELWGTEPDGDGGMRKAQIGQVRKVRFWNKEKALELLGKHMRMFIDRVEHSADDSFAEVLKKARERAKR
jgi:phage terminase small subunit